LYAAQTLVVAVRASRRGLSQEPPRLLMTECPSTDDGMPSLVRRVCRQSHPVTEDGEDELTKVRAEIQRLARLRYAQRRFTLEQQAEYEALVIRRNDLAAGAEDMPEREPDHASNDEVS
jgi:hypothetical protein